MEKSKGTYFTNIITFITKQSYHIRFAERKILIISFASVRVECVNQEETQQQKNYRLAILFRFSYNILHIKIN